MRLVVKMERFRQMTHKEKLRAYNLRREGHSYQSIADMLSNDAEDGRKFDRSTIYRVCQSMPSLPVDEPFELIDLEEYGIPWEASAYLLEMWAFAQEHSYFPEIPKYVVWQIPKESFRQARWWWRVHLAAPDLSLPVQKIVFLASGFLAGWEKKYAG